MGGEPRVREEDGHVGTGLGDGFWELLPLAGGSGHSELGLGDDGFWELAGGSHSELSLTAHVLLWMNCTLLLHDG